MQKAEHFTQCEAIALVAQMCAVIPLVLSARREDALGLFFGIKCGDMDPMQRKNFKLKVRRQVDFLRPFCT